MANATESTIVHLAMTRRKLRNLPVKFTTLIPDEQIATTMADVWIVSTCWYHMPSVIDLHTDFPGFLPTIWSLIKFHTTWLHWASYQGSWRTKILWWVRYYAYWFTGQEGFQREETMDSQRLTSSDWFAGQISFLDKGEVCKYQA